MLLTNAQNLKIYYTGSKAQWDKISFNNGNDELKNATIHYNHNPKITGLKATTTNNSIKLVWDKKSTAAYYRVYVAKDGKWAQLTQTKSNSIVSYTAIKLKTSTSYKFRVTAYNKGGKAIAYSDITTKTK